jgi:hypothetical protein
LPALASANLICTASTSGDDSPAHFFMSTVVRAPSGATYSKDTLFFVLLNFDYR